MKFFKNYIYETILSQPVSATWEEWRDWKKEAKLKNPLIFFFFITIDRYISRQIYRINEFFYNLKSKYITHPHHIKIDVDRFMNNCNNSFDNYNWISKGDCILYSSFQVLVDFVEKSSMFKCINWEGDQNQDQYDEIITLYEWWTEHRLDRKLVYPLLEDYGIEDSDMIFYDDNNIEDKLKLNNWNDACKNLEQTKDDYITEDTEMLIRLVILRTFLDNL